MARVRERRLAHDLTVPWAVPAGPTGVTAARRATRDQLAEFGVTDSDTIGVVELIVSELTSNVVKHVGGSATLRLQRVDGAVRVEVRDTDASRVPRERPPDLEGPAGRGLLLVSSLASSWGFDRSDGEKCTWAEVDLPTEDSSHGFDLTD